MASNFVNKVYSKTEEVLFSDKLKYSNKLNDLLANELIFLLNQYFEMKENSFFSKIFLEQNGDISINLSFKAKRVLIKRESEVV